MILNHTIGGNCKIDSRRYYMYVNKPKYLTLQGGLVMALKRISAASNYKTIFVLKCLTENFGFNIFRKYVAHFLVRRNLRGFFSVQGIVALRHVKPNFL